MKICKIRKPKTRGTPKMRAIFKKEMNTYFDTPFGYVFVGIYLVLSGIMFTLYNLLGGNSGLAGMFDLMKNFTFIIFPILTMRMFAEERKNGTEDYLLTSHLSVKDIVLGKFFAACALFAAALLVTLVYVGIIAVYGYADAASITVSYVGFFLLGVSMIAICTFTSSFADNQITAAISSFGVLFLMVMLLSFTKSLSVPIITPLLSALAITKQYDAFTLGVLTPGPVLYYIGVTAISLVLAVKNIELRRFR